MKELLKKIGLYTIDLGVSMLGVGAIGLAGYGAWNLAGMAASALTSGILTCAAMAGIVVAFAGVTLGLSVGMKKIFKWTAEYREDVRGVERFRAFGREQLRREKEDRNCVFVENAIPIEKDEIGGESEISRDGSSECSGEHSGYKAEIESVSSGDKNSDVEYKERLSI